MVVFSGFMLFIATSACAQDRIEAGLVTGVDAVTRTLTVETRSGSEQVVVAPTAAIRDDHDRAMALRDINPGDAVAYQGNSGPATSIHVARQFWAIPSES
jgi:hypothetical protein